MILRELLTARGFDPSGMIAIRNTLHPDDISPEFRDTIDIVSAKALPMYDRMQDGPRIADQAVVLSFVAIDNGQARLTSLRRFLLRRQGDVPGDIVYDYGAAHLLHSFIARAEAPCFYDVIEQRGLDDLFGKLVLQWPEPLTQNILSATEDALVVVAE